VTKDIFKDRRRRLAKVLHEKKLDGYLFGGISDLYYLTGFSSEGFFGLATAKGMWIFSSALLAQQIRENTQGLKIIVGKRLTVALKEIAAAQHLKKIGFDADQTFYRLGAALIKEGLTPSVNPLEELRIVKDREELDQLTKACHITAATVDWVIPRVKAGMSELQMSRLIRDGFEKRGSSEVAFELISAVGAHTALPHHRPTETLLKKNQAVLFDVGCRVGAYRSDLTRTFFYGTIPIRFPSGIRRRGPGPKSRVFSGQTRP
jgi:Xaa-Pro aminopeptidase